jgi:hypothetical protein
VIDYRTATSPLAALPRRLSVVSNSVKQFGKGDVERVVGRATVAELPGSPAQTDVAMTHDGKLAELLDRAFAMCGAQPLADPPPPRHRARSSGVDRGALVRQSFRG